MRGRSCFRLLYTKSRYPFARRLMKRSESGGFNPVLAVNLQSACVTPGIDLGLSGTICIIPSAPYSASRFFLQRPYFDAAHVHALHCGEIIDVSVSLRVLHTGNSLVFGISDRDTGSGTGSPSGHVPVHFRPRPYLAEPSGCVQWHPPPFSSSVLVLRGHSAVPRQYIGTLGPDIEPGKRS